MDQMAAMRAFSRVVEVGTFTRAAQLLDMPKPTLSKLIQGLESHLRTKLLNRTTRRVTVTADGAAYYERADVYRSLDKPEQALADVNEAIRLFQEHKFRDNYWVYDTYCMRGYIRTDLEDFAGAIQDLNQALSLVPKGYRARFLRARARELNGDLEGAIEDYSEVILKGQDDAVAFDEIADFVEEARIDVVGADRFHEGFAQVQLAVRHLHARGGIFHHRRAVVHIGGPVVREAQRMAQLMRRRAGQAGRDLRRREPQAHAQLHAEWISYRVR